MYVKFSIDRDAINKSEPWDQLADELLRKWKLGVLTDPELEDGGLEVLAFKAHQEDNKIWQDLFTTALGDPNLYKVAQGRFDVALISELRAQRLNIIKGDSKYQQSIEWVRLAELYESREFQNAQDDVLQQINELVARSGIVDPIRSGQAVDILWRSRFSRFARSSKNVVILDGYALRHDYNVDGVFRFLGCLDRDSSGCSVTIYSRARKLRPNENEADKLDNIKDELSSKAASLDLGGIQSIEVRIYSGKAFSRFAHDRHVRFDDNVFLLGRGMDIFNEDVVMRATDMAQVTLFSTTTEHKESALENKATRIADFSIPIGTP